jgi:hypothetical protein
MGKPKSLIKNMSIDTAKVSHFCKHNGKHKILKGEKRLKLKVGRSYQHFCTVCAKNFLEIDITKLQNLLIELEKESRQD